MRLKFFSSDRVEELWHSYKMWYHWGEKEEVNCHWNGIRVVLRCLCSSGVYLHCVNCALQFYCVHTVKGRQMSYNFLQGNWVVRPVLSSQEKSLREVIWFLKFITLWYWKRPPRVSQYIHCLRQDHLYQCYSCQTCTWRCPMLNTPTLPRHPILLRIKHLDIFFSWFTLCWLLVKYFSCLFWKSPCRLMRWLLVKTARHNSCCSHCNEDSAALGARV